ncbi:MAG: hypothetical protein J6J38_04110 [Lachnospiraceae bacterium]|nr:hypothetical protein [Lachnospiraceae bacterium]
MKRAKKVIAGALIAATVLATGGISVYAAEHKTGCSANAIEIRCTGPFYYTSAGYHVLYVTPNGEARCWKTAGAGRHDLYCANSACQIHLSMGPRLHEMDHEYCPSETGLCQIE